MTRFSECTLSYFAMLAILTNLLLHFVPENEYFTALLNVDATNRFSLSERRSRITRTVLTACPQSLSPSATMTLTLSSGSQVPTFWWSFCDNFPVRICFSLRLCFQLVFYWVSRISDRGGGISHARINRVWQYGFTTSDKDAPSNNADGGIFGQFTENRATGAMHGCVPYTKLFIRILCRGPGLRYLNSTILTIVYCRYGFGLPACRAYVEYLGGSLTMESMQGIGTDVYIRLRHIDGKVESFRIWVGKCTYQGCWSTFLFLGLERKLWTNIGFDFLEFRVTWPRNTHWQPIRPRFCDLETVGPIHVSCTLVTRPRNNASR